MVIKRILTYIIFTIAQTFFIHTSQANSMTIPMYLTAQKGFGTPIGKITIVDTKHGLLLIPELHHLSAGGHGFHVHVYPHCEQKGMAAGGHFDPKHTEKHLGPYNDLGHLGDLPILYVDEKGEAATPTLAPRLSVNNIKGHALIIHADGDNYSDYPTALGGGGERIACGIWKEIAPESKHKSY